MFPAPVSVFADGREVDLVIVPGVRVDLSVKDIETGDVVAAFTARATSGELVLFDVAGTDGAFATCIRLPAQLAPEVRAAQGLMASGDFAGAAEALTAFTRTHPDDGRAWSLLGAARGRPDVWDGLPGQPGSHTGYACKGDE